jgi:hypothetical protein
MAVETGALSRRRGVKSGEDLLRVLLLCALPKASMRSVSRLVAEMGLGVMNPSAVFFRLRDSEAFLRTLLSRLLEPYACGGSLRVVDATVLCGPGATGVDQRAHVCYRPDTGLPVAVELTGPRGGEHLWRHPLGPGHIVLADRGYGYERELCSALDSGADFLVRVEPCSNRFLLADGSRFNYEEAALESEGPQEFEVFYPGRPEALRLVGSVSPKGKRGWLLTNLDPELLPAGLVRQLYRTRWQVELFFKRMKSLLDLDELPTRNGPTARSWILAKFVLAVLLVRLDQEVFSPRQTLLKRLAEIQGWPLDYLEVIA